MDQCESSEQGLSPRMWGRDGRRCGLNELARVIPTRVGKRNWLRGPHTVSEGDPHACGEEIRLAILGHRTPQSHSWLATTPSIRKKASPPIRGSASPYPGPFFRALSVMSIMALIQFRAHNSHAFLYVLSAS
jgi:hypothetical protein